MSQSWKVFFACAFGAAIGTMIALELHPALAWLGGIAGGVVGYFSYEFRRVIAAIRIAWLYVIRWRPDTEYWMLYRRAFIYSFCELLLLTLWMFFAAGMLMGPMLFSIEPTARTGWSILISISFVALTFVLAFEQVGDSTRLILVGKESLEEYQKRTVRMLIQRNPASVIFFQLPRFAIKGGRYAVRRFPDGIRIALRFLWTVFKLIHSEERLLCGIDAFAGAMVGYFSGSVLLGAVAGGLIGVANYEIVSRRILKVVPVRAK